MSKSYLTAYFSPDQEFQGRTRDKQFEECNSWGEYIHYGRVPTALEELANFCLLQHLQELKEQTNGCVWVALWNADKYLGQFLFNTDVCIPEPVPEVWTEFLEEIK